MVGFGAAAAVAWLVVPWTAATGVPEACGLRVSPGPVPTGDAVARHTETPRPAAHPQLDALGARIVGAWEADGSRQVHEWGVGRRLIRSRGYALSGGEWMLVSEGIWYWDGEAGALRGVHLAVGMPVERFEYRTVVEGDVVTHELTAYGDTVERFVETWDFADGSYRWRLDRPDPEGPMRVMEGTWRRVNINPHQPSLPPLPSGVY